jgi:PTH1 family peptidyl-tRNA hydrolase
MNNSGLAVAKFLGYYKLRPENVLVIHDDINIEPLKLKIKFSGGSGGHNGIRSIDNAIGSKYWRLRIGVGRPAMKEQVSDYVLSNFDSGTLADLQQTILKPLSTHLLDLIQQEDKESVIAKMRNQSI